MSGLHIRLSLINLNVDLHCPGQGISAIIGPSGAGKTTMLRAIAGLNTASRGRIEVNNEIWQDDDLAIFLPTYQRPIGFVFQEASLFAHLSVKGNLEFGFSRIPKAEKKMALDDAIDLLGLSPLLDRSPSTLSGGEKQRICIARALVTNPKLMLMDEPLAALDEQRKEEIFPYLERLHREFSMPILYVSHVSEEVVRLADYVVILEEGKVKASGSVSELLTRSDLSFGQTSQTSVIMMARIIKHDAQLQRTQVELNDGVVWLPKIEALPGSTVPLKIMLLK